MYYWPEPFRRLTFGNKFLCMQCPLNHVSRIVVLCFACDRLMTLKYPTCIRIHYEYGVLPRVQQN